MFCKAASTLLIFLLLVNVCAISIVKFGYESNKAYFTEKFCVNKAKPQMKCQGKCHLNKTLKKIDSNQNKDKSAQNLSISFEYLPTVAFAFTIENSIVSENNIYSNTNIFSFLYFSELNKPPISV